MITVITESVLLQAIKLNKRDQRRLDTTIPNKLIMALEILDIN